MLLIAVLAPLALALPPCALGGEAWIQGFTLHYEAGFGEQNTVTLTKGAFAQPYAVVDTTAVVSAGSGCVRVSDHRADCGGAFVLITNLDVRVYGLADFVDIESDAAAYVDGGTNDDTILGGSGNDTLRGETFGLDDPCQGGVDTIDGRGGDDTVQGGSNLAGCSALEWVPEELRGGPGNDTIWGGCAGVSTRCLDGRDNLHGGTGDDTLLGEDGDDLLSGGFGRDTLTGGDGRDTADYSNRANRVVVNLGVPGGDGELGENDDVQNAEVVVGGAAGDSLTGDGAANELLGGEGSDSLAGGGGDDDLVPGSGMGDTLAGGDGVDTADYSFATQALDLSIDGLANDGGAGESDNVALDVENVTGGSGNDDLHGSDGDNRLDGGPGTDTLFGGRGDDRLLDGGGNGDVLAGGTGIDIADYSSRTVPLSLTDDLVANDGAAGEGDNIIGVRTIVGGSGDDTLAGQSGSGDTLNGGPGVDSVSYADRPHGVVVALDGIANDGRPGENDNLWDVENVTGGPGDDRLSGNRGANVIDGGAGDDVLDGGPGPELSTEGCGPGAPPYSQLSRRSDADVLLGGAGTDTADYSGRDRGVVVRLDGLANDGWRWIPCDGSSGVEGDGLTGIENLDGSRDGDILGGDDGSNRLRGGGGDDDLSSGSGDDLLAGGEGDDRFDGGDGVDTADFGSAASVRVDLAAGTATGESDSYPDTLAAIEDVVGSPGDDTILGGAGDDRLLGDGGADTIEGRAGADALFGDAGADTIDSSDGGTADQVDCGPDTDVAQADSVDAVVACEQVTGPDDAPPTVTVTVTPDRNAAGWHRTNVTVALTAVDEAGGSGVDAIVFRAATGFVVTVPETTVAGGSATVELTHEGLTELAFHARDEAGNMSAPRSLWVAIDKTDPTLTFGAPSPAPNGAGWNNTDVTVAFSVFDATSGVASTLPATSPLVLSGEGSAVSGSVEVTDVAGNTASFASPAAAIDRTPPDLTVTTSPDANTAGWNRSPVTVTFGATDALAGVASVTPPSVVAAEGAGRRIEGVAVDRAGNRATATATVNLDVTAPAVSCAAPDGAWHAVDVAIACTAADGLSGLAATGDASFSLATSVAAGEETANAETGTRSVCDVAGNCAAAGPIPGSKIDRRAPAIALVSPSDGALYGLGATVLAAYTCSDAGSGIAGCTGTNPSGAAIDTAAVGPRPFAVVAVDSVGNTTRRSVVYGVRWDFTGFFAPVDNPPLVNGVAAGATVPVKFSLGGDRGLAIMADGYPRSQAIPCDASATVDGIEETVAAGSSGLSYDPLTLQYAYRWKTDKAWAGTCRQLVVRLADGSVHEARFSLR